ncbi:hypothetical protein CAEBREN_15110 [Caenorhabditis brenneri]|uniref:Uncharacterized protein n=1 Tax=Caenorhabditis brenneri TaxID=135651 RepID=G0PBJ4_CAEBE|nr:hypothetical protein CAEBREN_15110 [Caenorhabditis brenneri]
MPAQFLQTRHNRQYPLRRKTRWDTPTILEEIHHYTQMLTDTKRNTLDILRALSRLNKLDASIRIYEQAGLENVLKEFYSDTHVVFAYQVNKLHQKMDKLRKNEQKSMSPWEGKMEVDKEEEEYDPEYPEVRPSAEIDGYKLPKTSKLLLEYDVYGHVAFAYEVNKLHQQMDKLRKNEQSQWEEKMEVDNEEAEYDPEYPEIRSSAEMATYKLPKTSKLLLEYDVYGHVAFAYEVNKLHQKMDKLRKNKQKSMRPWEERMEVDNEEEEYNPEYPEIRSSAEMAKYKLPKTSKLLLEYDVYIPTPICPASNNGFCSSSSSSGALLP